MSIQRREERFAYSSHRFHTRDAVTFQAEYGPAGEFLNRSLAR